MTPPYLSTTRSLRTAMACVSVAAVVTACGADSDSGLNRVDAAQTPVMASTQTKMGDPQNWSVGTTTGNGDGYVFYGDNTYQWLDAACISDLRGASVQVATVAYQDIIGLTQLPGVGDCSAVRAALSNGDGDEQWRVVTTTDAGDGYVLYGNGTRQWLDAACVSRLRGAGATVQAVQWPEVSGQTQLPGVADCDAVAQNIDTDDGGNNGSGDPWQVVTTTRLGDGYVIYPNNTRQWLSAACISQLRAGTTLVRAVTWDDIKDIPQSEGIGECDAVARNATSGGTGDGTVCNKFSDGGFENGLGNWQSNGDISIVADAYNGAQAVNVSNGSFSYEIDTADVGTKVSFIGHYSGNGTGEPAYAGIDFLRDGMKIGGVASTLTPYPEGIQFGLDYSLFIRNATVPAEATSIRAWIYSEFAVTVDDLELRNADCANAPQIAGAFLTVPRAGCRLKERTEIDGRLVDTETPAGSVRLDLDRERGNFFVDGIQIANGARIRYFSRGDQGTIEPTPRLVFDGAAGGQRGSGFDAGFFFDEQFPQALTRLDFSRSALDYVPEGRDQIVSTFLSCYGDLP